MRNFQNLGFTLTVDSDSYKVMKTVNKLVIHLLNISIDFFWQLWGVGCSGFRFSDVKLTHFQLNSHWGHSWALEPNFITKLLMLFQSKHGITKNNQHLVSESVPSKVALSSPCGSKAVGEKSTKQFIGYLWMYQVLHSWQKVFKICHSSRK